MASRAANNLLALSPLGSGLGGLDWPEVRRKLARFLDGLDGVRVVVFEPGGGPEDLRANRSSDVPNMTPGRAVLVALMDHYIRVLLDPFITLLEVHKLMYFMQIAGEPLRLKLSKGAYGPYAENLRHVLNALEGHFIAGYFDGGDNPGKPLELVPGAIDNANAFLASHEGTRARLHKVLELVEGFESSYGLELLATVHWVVDQEHHHDFNGMMRQVRSWGGRTKLQFTQRQLRMAVDRLLQGGWIRSTSLSIA